MTAMVAALALAGCHGSDKPKQTDKPKPVVAKPIPFNPAFVDVAGRWTSQAGPTGHFLQMDVASAGAISLEIRIGHQGGAPEVLATRHGTMTIDHDAVRGSLTTTPKDTASTDLAALAKFTGRIEGKDDDRRMTISGAGATTYELAYDGR